MSITRRLVDAAPTLVGAPALGAFAMLSLPHVGVWWSAPLAIGVLASWGRARCESEAAAGSGRPWRRTLALVFAFWTGAYAFGLWWIAELTVPGWIVAVPVEAAVMTLPLTAALCAAASRRPLWAIRRERLGRGTVADDRAGTAAVGALLLAAALVLAEAVRWAVPFGGVPMSSFALAAANAPWAPVARLGGPLAVVGVTATLAAIVDAVVVLPRAWARAHDLGATWGSQGGPSRARLRRTAMARVWRPLVLAAALTGIAVAAPAGTAESELRAAVVQSGGSLGSRAGDSGRRDVFAAHEAVVRANAAALADVDLMVWSESSAHSDGPLERSPELSRLEKLATDVDTTIVANFYERTRDGDRFRNATVVVAPAADGGYVGRYDKVHLVPFGEYVPLRGLVDTFSDLSLVPRDAVAGSQPGLVDSPFGPLAVVTSYEVYFAGRARSGVDAGGRLLVNPTLASSYTTDWVPAQSLAAARLRALESGRWVLQASTTGYSAIVDPDGRVVVSTATAGAAASAAGSPTPLGEPALLISTVELRSGRTFAHFLGTWPVFALALAGFAYALRWPRGLREARDDRYLAGTARNPYEAQYRRRERERFGGRGTAG
ncbi:MAG TPA: apolipoprotein N-acyltransferase [Acidimicrobiaceae bacterium]|nr:apolipoprotein N-acyltransferase [Acidimicrobiaceae bacterium]